MAKICLNCGVQLDEDVQQCNACGKSVATDVAAENEEVSVETVATVPAPTVKKANFSLDKKLLPVLSVSAVACIAVIVLLFYWIFGS